MLERDMMQAVFSSDVYFKDLFVKKDRDQLYYKVFKEKIFLKHVYCRTLHNALLWLS